MINGFNNLNGYSLQVMKKIHKSFSIPSYSLKSILLQENTPLLHKKSFLFLEEMHPIVE
jgi:hypothetical protein